MDECSNFFILFLLICRCLRLAVVHDLAECIVGDITPSDPMGKEEKHRREKVNSSAVICLWVCMWGG